ncbi:MAG: haloacid dehalogenase type II [Bacteroidota bacterium]
MFGKLSFRKIRPKGSASAAGKMLRPKAITFDCYGTLIDWETGIKGVLQKILWSKNPGGLRVETVFRRWREVEFDLIQKGYKPYRMVLRESLVATLQEFGFIQLFEDEEEALGKAMPTWRPFPEVERTLRKLKTLYRVAVISNVDGDIIERNLKFLDVQFDSVMTAEHARAYKPSRKIFELAWRELDGAPSEFLHVGASHSVDIVAARGFGCPTVWVSRPTAQANPTDTEPDSPSDFVVKDLSGLLEIVDM